MRDPSLFISVNLNQRTVRHLELVFDLISYVLVTSQLGLAIQSYPWISTKNQILFETCSPGLKFETFTVRAVMGIN